MTNKEAIKYLQQFYPHGGHSWLDAQRMEAIKMAIDALQEEPVSEDRTSYDVGFYEGYKKCKQQMMKDAVDGKIYETQARSKLKATTTGKISGLKYRVGDEVKIIIIKED